jgi:hypothetical protein
MARIFPYIPQAHRKGDRANDMDEPGFSIFRRENAMGRGENAMGRGENAMRGWAHDMGAIGLCIFRRENAMGWRGNSMGRGENAMGAPSLGIFSRNVSIPAPTD